MPAYSITSSVRASRVMGRTADLPCNRARELVASVCDWLEPLLDPRGASEPDELAPVLDLLCDELCEFVR